MQAALNSKQMTMSKSIVEVEVTVLNPKLETRREKRMFLRNLSKPAADLIEEGEVESVNEYLLQLYFQQEGKKSEFNSYKKWRKLGFQVKKGESAFLVWGKPKAIETEAEKQEAQEDNEGEDSKKKDFYPLAYLFSSKQVENLKKQGGQNV